MFTDGEINDGERTLNFLSENSHHLRIFSVGVGSRATNMVRYSFNLNILFYFLNMKMFYSLKVARRCEKKEKRDKKKNLLRALCASEI